MNRDQSENRVFVLGAGASRAVKSQAPLNDELLYKILERHQQFRVNKLREFVSDFYNISYRGRRWQDSLPAIEDVLSQLDFSLSEKRPLSSVFSLPYLQVVRDQLISGICKLLRTNLDNKEGLDKVYRFMRMLSDRDAIISLNYDLVVDSAICRCRNSPQYVDYDIPIRQAINRQEETFAYKPNSPFKVFKLHGSLNWLYCPHCQTIDVTMEEDGTINYIASYGADQLRCCPYCQVPFESVIVAPTFLKTYNNTYISQLWRNAELALSKASEIIFIGYSMPDADIVLRCMFKRAYYSGSTHGDMRHSRITVIDYVDPKKKGQGSYVNYTRKRFEKLFREVVYDDTGFECYIDHGCQTVAQSIS